MESVTEDVLRDGMRDMLSKGITPRTLSKRYTILKTILDAAERRGLIAENTLNVYASADRDAKIAAAKVIDQAV